MGFLREGRHQLYFLGDFGYTYFAKHTVLLGELRGMSPSLPPRNFFKWCDFVHFKGYFQPLFDCLLKPKLLYGCEIWGNGSCKSLELYHTRFIKKTLDVKTQPPGLRLTHSPSLKSTTNTSMIYAETGRFPLAIDINVQIIKYWLKNLGMESNSYVKLVYNTLVDPRRYNWSNSFTN